MKKRKVLSAFELKALLKVATTPTQARQIIKRCQAALKALVPGNAEVITIGCPHCQDTPSDTSGRARCVQCAYGRANEGRIGTEFCTSYLFGGLAYYKDASTIITLLKNSITVSTYGSTKQTRKAAHKWLIGHIEWGEEVLRLDLAAKAKAEAKKSSKPKRKKGRR